MDLGLEGKKVIVTGGSRGIGRACVEAFAGEGAQVAFCARGAQGVEQAVAEIGAGDMVRGYSADVRDSDSLNTFMHSAIKDLGGVDALVANVSGGGSDPSYGGWQTGFEVDMMASVRCADIALPELARRGGAIVFISSIMATECLGGVSPYGAMKAALINYASQLGDSVGTHGVRVNVVSPGPIYVEDGFWGQMERAQPGAVADVKARHAAGRLGTAEEVANAVLFLASARASWITRTNVTVDGGFSRRIQF